MKFARSNLYLMFLSTENVAVLWGLRKPNLAISNRTAVLPWLNTMMFKDTWHLYFVWSVLQEPHLVACLFFFYLSLQGFVLFSSYWLTSLLEVPLIRTLNLWSILRVIKLTVMHSAWSKVKSTDSHKPRFDSTLSENLPGRPTTLQCFMFRIPTDLLHINTSWPWTHFSAIKKNLYQRWYSSVFINAPILPVNSAVG